MGYQASTASTATFSCLFISISSFFCIVHHSAPYVIVGFITVLSMLCLSLTSTFLPQITSVTSLHLFQASLTLFLQYVMDPPSASNIDPRYVKVATLFTSSPIVHLSASSIVLFCLFCPCSVLRVPTVMIVHHLPRVVRPMSPTILTIRHKS